MKIKRILGGVLIGFASIAGAVAVGLLTTSLKKDENEPEKSSEVVGDAEYREVESENEDNNASDGDE